MDNLAVDDGHAAGRQAAERMSVKDGDVGILAFFQRADTVLQLEGAGRIDGDALKGRLVRSDRGASKDRG